MDIKRIAISRSALVAGLLVASTGLAQAYAVPPTPHADLGPTSAGIGILLWLPLLVLVLALAAATAWSLRTGRTHSTARREQPRRLTAPDLSVTAPVDPQPRRSGRSWRRVAALAH